MLLRRLHESRLQGSKKLTTKCFHHTFYPFLGHSIVHNAQICPEYQSLYSWYFLICISNNNYPLQMLAPAPAQAAGCQPVNTTNRSRVGDMQKYFIYCFISNALSLVFWLIDLNFKIEIFRIYIIKHLIWYSIWILWKIILRDYVQYQRRIRQSEWQACKHGIVRDGDPVQASDWSIWLILASDWSTT